MGRFDTYQHRFECFFFFVNSTIPNSVIYAMISNVMTMPLRNTYKQNELKSI